MKILLIAPHQDDEILAAGGLLQKCIKKGDHITILFATNGDYRGKKIAHKRYYESKDALGYLGIPEEAIFYLGYGDTGMNYSHSFLRKMLFSEDDRLLTSHVSSMTYHPSGRKTVHAIKSGVESSLTKKTFLEDLEWFIEHHFPDIIIVSDSLDMHGDHSSIIDLLQKTNIFYKIPLCLTYIIHGGDDLSWPQRNSITFACPPSIPLEKWEKRFSIPLTMQEQICKHNAIALFTTQLKEDDNNFLLSFSKQEEFFFLFRENKFNRQKICSHFEYKEI